MNYSVSAVHLEWNQGTKSKWCGWLKFKSGSDKEQSPSSHLFQSLSQAHIIFKSPPASDKRLQTQPHRFFTCEKTHYSSAAFSLLFDCLATSPWDVNIAITLIPWGPAHTATPSDCQISSIWKLIHSRVHPFYSAAVLQGSCQRSLITLLHLTP